MWTQIIDNGSLALKAEKMKQEYGSGTSTAFGFWRIRVENSLLIPMRTVFSQKVRLRTQL